ncbi:MAG: DUF4388 domain-containing protein [Chloroflexi bacterium]|nr:MAG: DUF4388 domain-containing protein [Chloroflexota bacterium]
MQGNLRDVSLTQVLNIINLSRKTGTLVLYEAKKTGQMEKVNAEQERERIEAGAERAHIVFKEGKLVHARIGEQDGNLVTVLNKSGKLTDGQAKIIRERTKNVNDKAIALKLIGANYVTQKDIINSIQQYTMDIVYNMSSWKQEPFRFQDNVMPTVERIMVPIDLKNVIIELSRREEMLTELNNFLPDLDRPLKFPPDLKQKFQGVHLSVEEWRVVSYVDPKNTIRQIAKASNMSDVEIRRVVYGLVQAGLVQVVEPAAGSALQNSSGRRARPRPKSSNVQADVVNRLISKIKSM